VTDIFDREQGVIHNHKTRREKATKVTDTAQTSQDLYLKSTIVIKQFKRRTWVTFSRVPKVERAFVFERSWHDCD